MGEKGMMTPINLAVIYSRGVVTDIDLDLGEKGQGYGPACIPAGINKWG
jgi:hypothetical protein